MNVLKIGALIILLPLSIDLTKASEDKSPQDLWRNPGFYSPSSAPTSSYGYDYGYSSNLGTQAPLTEKEIEFNNLEESFREQFRETFYIPSSSGNLSIDEKIKMIKLEIEFKTLENIYEKKFHGSFYCSDYQASKVKQIEMIKEELKLKEAEDAYSKKFRKDFRFSQCGIENSYTALSTAEKIKMINEETEYQGLLSSFVEESLGLPHISDVVITAQPGELKAAQIKALKEELEIQRLIRSLAITEQEIEDKYPQLTTTGNGLPTRSTVLNALQAEKLRRETR